MIFKYTELDRSDETSLAERDFSPHSGCSMVVELIISPVNPHEENISISVLTAGVLSRRERLLRKKGAAP